MRCKLCKWEGVLKPQVSTYHLEWFSLKRPSVHAKAQVFQVGFRCSGKRFDTVKIKRGYS